MGQTQFKLAFSIHIRHIPAALYSDGLVFHVQRSAALERGIVAFGTLNTGRCVLLKGQSAGAGQQFEFQDKVLVVLIHIQRYFASSVAAVASGNHVKVRFMLLFNFVK